MNIKMIAVAAACVTVAGGGVAGTVVMNSPKVVALKAIGGVVDDLLAREEIQPIYDMLKGGSLEVSLSNIKQNGQVQAENPSLDGKVYFSQDSLMLEDVKLKYGLLNLEGTAYISPEMIYVEEEKILEGAYAIEVDSFANDLEDSIFAYGSGSKYAITDKEEYNNLIDLLDSSLEFKKAGKDLEKIAKKYAKKISKIVADNIEYKSENGKERLNGEKEKVRIITMKIDGDCLSNIISDVYYFLADDDRLRKHFDDYEDEYSLLAGDFLKNGETIAEWYEDYLEELEDGLDDICDEIEESDNKIEVEVITPKLQAKLLKMSVNVNREEVFMLDFGVRGLRKTDKITVEFGEEELVYEIEENNAKKYKATLNNGFIIDIDKEKGEYSLTMDTRKITGRFVKSFNSIKFTVDKVKDWMSQITMDCEITINMKDKMPRKPKEYKTIADIATRDIDQWLKKLG